MMNINYLALTEKLLLNMIIGMKKINLIVYVVLILSVLSSHLVMASSNVNVRPTMNGLLRPFIYLNKPDPAPITPFYTETGGVSNLNRYRGKVVLLNVWATWCVPCLYELPMLDQLAVNFDTQDFAVVNVSIDDNGVKPVKRYFKRLKINNLTTFIDPLARIVDAYSIKGGFPWTFVINRAGEIEGYIKGAAEWDNPDAKNLIQYFINKR